MGLKVRNTHRCYTVGRVGGYVIFMLTDAYGGYRWVSRKYLNAYGGLHGGVGVWVSENLSVTQYMDGPLGVVGN